ncbi:MAG: metallophosphoesterase [Clostridia bacterium]|nr:metallophosphoesterase [Clostridia bacterium]
MSKTYFIADTHFGSDALRRYENRPFADVQEMDEELIRRWNEAVAPEDTVWHLGDFGAEGREAEYLARLNGKVNLVKGNHDAFSNEYYRKAGFSEVYDLPVVFEGYFILSHEPLYVNANMPYANLFGHVHANPIIKNMSSQHFCVCVERTGYAPVSFGHIKDSMR